jgi:hypothetical protein
VHITPVDPEVATAKVPIEMNLSIADKRWSQKLNTGVRLYS